MNLIDTNTMLPTEARCRELLVRLRWPEGPRCPRCNMDAVELETDKQLFYCKGCDYQFSVTAGTIFNDSHLPLTTWFAATLLICEAKKGISACQIQRTLGIGSYKTAWYLCHRIRAAMTATEKPMLDGTTGKDETYVGGMNKGMGRCSGMDNEEVVVGIRKRNGDLRFFHSKDAKSGTLAQYVRENIGEDVDVIFTDDAAAYPVALRKASKNKKRHETVAHRKKEYVRGHIHADYIESAFSLLKRGIAGTWHHISAKHLATYLEEMEFRFNRRKNSDLFLDSLRHMVTAPVLTFQKLTA